VLFSFLYACNGQSKAQGAKHEFTNDLVYETSPYLLQHAHNPVHWKPWNEKFLEEAKVQDKLLLVSIGYSSCHWCHVMNEETFEDPEIAEIMNSTFINIKVDREERPDVDQVYMTALQLIKGNGGWPLNAIILPNGKPLYVGTYHTKEQWKKVLLEVSTFYKNNPEKAREYGEMVAQGIQELNIVEPSSDRTLLSREVLSNGMETWKLDWDTQWGGDTSSQKFMQPSHLAFLLDYSFLTGDEASKSHVENTLDKMAMGGVYDQLGGGFFRYSVDYFWKVPHFEKMLYDNAQMIGVYSKGFGMFKKPEYQKIVAETVQFLEREMKNKEGGYYAAKDADTDGEEGKTYVWKEQELREVLQEDFDLFSKYYTIKAEAVWEAGNFVLHKTLEDEVFSAQHNIKPADLEAHKRRWKERLLEVRDKRPQPKIDDKVIVSWNALLINGFIEAYRAFGEQEYLDRAEAIFRFIKSKTYQNKQLVHSYKTNSKRTEGFLEDYAYLIEASIQLYSVTLDENYLDFAVELDQLVSSQFLDPKSQLFSYTKDNELIAQIIKTDDGVLPSPNAIMARNLFRIGHILYDMERIEKSKAMLSSMVPHLKSDFAHYAVWNSLLVNNTYPYFEIAVVGKDAKSIVNEMNLEYLPNTLLVGSLKKNSLPLFMDRYAEGETLIYVCVDNTCKLPVATVAEALVQLKSF
jgi:uncharacterized protein YyaL (SSP411 family)